MFWTRYKWRIAMFALGAVVGAVGAASFSGRPSPIRNATSTALSHGIAAKRKAQALMETAKENVEDLVAEADQKLQDRQQAASQE